MIKRILHYIKILPAFLFSNAYRLVDPVLKLLPVKTVEHYDVVILRTDGIGDFAMWASAIPAYRNKYYGKTIAFVFPDSYASIVKSLGLFEELVTFNKKGVESNFKKHLSFAWKLKHISAEVVINPTRYRIYPSDSLVGMITAPQKIGVEVKRTGLYNTLLDGYYTELIKLPSIQHEMLNTEFITRTLTFDSYVHSLADFRSLAEHYEAPFDSDYCIVALSSADEYKIWEIEKVNELIKYIPQRYKIVLTGYGAKDEERARFVLRNNHNSNQIFNFVGRTNMLSLTQMVAKSCFVLGNDSATVHLAAACRVPSICYLAGAAYNEFIPYPPSIGEQRFHPRPVAFNMECFGCHYRCTQEVKSFKALLCIRNITVDMVNAKLQELLKELEIN